MNAAAAITISIDPYIDLGPLALAWHGLTIAIGLLVGAWVTARVAEEYGLPTERLTTLLALITVSGMVGGRLLYLAEHDGLLRPGEWLGTHGFSFNGGFALAALATAVYVRRTRSPLRLLDAIAVGVPLGIAVGRIGDLINGEHYGPPTDSPLGVRNSHPDASVPSPEVAYHSGGLYDMLIGVVIFAIVWPLRHRLRRPTELMWLVVALLGAGRFVEFFARSDSDTVALGLNSAQWSSLAILAAGVIGLMMVHRSPGAPSRPARARERAARPSR